MNTPLERLRAVRSRIADACHSAGRDPAGVSLLAVSKRHAPERVTAFRRLGLKDFGENQLQEAVQKQKALADLDITWHFIGAIQSNKTRAIAEHFHWVQSVDRPKVLRRLAAQRPPSMGALNICLQVNVDEELQKSGATPDGIMELAELAGEFENLRLRGLMAIPRLTDVVAEQRRSFRKVREVFERLKQAGFEVDTLSMGMSADLEAAITEGSTMVRIGTDLLGVRPS
jgi:pyridoxal phosphate enzyme (YggS family)